MRSWWALLVALAGAVVLAIVATTPPRPVGADAAPTAFSAARAMADVRVLGREPHPTGSAGNAAVRAHLIARLRALGLEVSTTRAKMDARGAARLAKWSGSSGDPNTAPPLTNIIAVLPGRDRTAPAVLLMAHHDGVWDSPAAADDAAGIAAILETVRAIQASGRPRARDLMVVLTDGEELGLQGAKAFFRSDPRRSRAGVVVNLETRGGGGRAQMFETGAGNGAMMDLFARAVVRPVATSLSVLIYNTLPNSTDYTVPKRLGVPGFNFAFIGRPGLYHSPLATADALDQGALQDIGRQTLDLTQALLVAPVLPGKAPDRTFFDAFGLVFVSYPAAIGWLFLGLAVAGYAVAGWGRADGREIARGAMAMIGLILLSVLALYLVNVVSLGFGKGQYYDRLAAIPRLQVQALLVCLAVVALMRRWFPLRVGGVAGAAVPLLLLGVVVQGLAPTASYVLAMPLMLGGLALALGRISKPAGSIAVIAAAVLGAGYMLGFGYFLMQAVGPRSPMVAALPLAVSTVLLLPLMPEFDRRRATYAAIALLVAAVAVASWVLLDPLAASAATYEDVK